MESARRSLAAFAAFCGPTVLWLVVFFLIPVGIVWMYSFGENVSLTEIETTWTDATGAETHRVEILCGIGPSGAPSCTGALPRSTEVRRKGESVGADAQICKPDLRDILGTVDALLFPVGSSNR